MLGEDVEIVALRNAILGKDRVVDPLAEPAKILGATPLVDINSY
jgi:hypothetical protein